MTVLESFCENALTQKNKKARNDIFLSYIY